MCGICGLVSFEKDYNIDPGLIWKMTDSMFHRGPDDAGIWTGKHSAFGHRRLSIIDIATGQQPMSIDDEGISYTIVFNGEIYNYLDLKIRLSALGYVFRTESDTEVILNAYRQWGNECVLRLRGMFAFAIWDGLKSQLFLARDRLGIKPLYYYSDEHSFLFASEIKGILVSDSVKFALEEKALDSYLSLGYVPAPLTMFRGISKVLPGQTIAVEPNGKLSKKTYWNFDRIEPAEMTFSDASSSLERLLKKTVQKHLMSEVPLGVFLSGGLDSSAITALISEMSIEKIKTFSVGYRGCEEVDELSYARKVAKIFHTEHHEFVLEPYGFFETIPQLVNMTEEPLLEPAAISLYHLSKQAKRYATVLLSGEGGDEVFAGYALYNKMLKMELARHFGALIRRIPNIFLSGDKIKKYSDWLSRSIQSRYRGTSCDLTNRIKHFFYSPEFLSYTQQNNYLDEAFLNWFRDVRDQPLLSQMLYVDSKTWLLDDLLLKADKTTMAASLELRVPFLDHKIVEFAASLPPEYKINHGEGKFILKKTMEKYLPKEIIYRRKMGFTVPTKRWFAGELMEPAKDIIFSKKLMDTGWFQKKYLVTMFERHNAGKEDYSRRIFSLLALYYWLETFG